MLWELVAKGCTSYCLRVVAPATELHEPLSSGPEAVLGEEGVASNLIKLCNRPLDRSPVCKVSQFHADIMKAYRH